MDTAVVLDVVRKGTPLSTSQDAEREFRRRDIRLLRGGYLTVPLVYVLIKTKLFLSAVVMKEGVDVKVGGEVDLSDKELVQAWARIKKKDLSSAAKAELESAINQLIDNEEKRFVDFFNRASPITTRMHSLELMPGIGKKHMWEIIENRRKPFESLQDIKDRIPLILDPKRSIRERILKELEEEEKYYFFILPPRRPQTEGYGRPARPFGRP
ncbi:MAG: DUF655 domain-containing protein [Candidatus Altiarchaeota archaeon]|nr:DUF655 domain-containing protein [Candidatus Altiarchaeota archaeon]